MAIIHDGDELVFCCDRCPRTLDSGNSDLGKAWMVAFGRGWRGEVVAGKSRHICPDCAQQTAA